MISIHFTSAIGYAYSGGGCRIIRVDVTADCGQNWRTADLINEDGKTSLIRCWTWSLWQIEIPLDPTIVKQEVKYVEIVEICLPRDTS